MGGFFLDRPVFAWVLALVTLLAGLAALRVLPVEHYPAVAPPTIRVSATLPGATAEAMQTSVTQVIEDALTDLDGLLYTESLAREGRTSLTLTFASGTDARGAQTDVQARIAQVERRLPDEVRSRGIGVTRASPAMLMVGALVSTDGTQDAARLGDLVTAQVAGAIRRTPGVGEVTVFASGYALRVWLDPLALAGAGLTPPDVVAALRDQGAAVTVGTLGAAPAVEGQGFTASLTAQATPRDPAAVAGMLLTVAPDGAAVRLSDVARVEIGSTGGGGAGARLDGLPAAGFGITLAEDGNAVATSAAVQETMRRLSTALPPGVELRVAYDTAPFVAQSIARVLRTLVEALVLVVLVLGLFLGDARAVLVPVVAVPVVLTGTLAVLWAAGMTLNTLTLFALVLAIGLLVDDAIVVVENVIRLMREEGLTPRAATRRTLAEMTGALIGIVVVLSAVFVPMGFFPGAAGVIYRQVSVTLIAAMGLSLLVALILTPAICGQILRPARDLPRATRLVEAGVARLRARLGRAVGRLARRPGAMALLLVAVIAGALAVAGRLSPGFLPTEDQGVLTVRVALGPGATQEQTRAVADEVADWLRREEGGRVASVYAAPGFGPAGAAGNSALMYVRLTPWAARAGAEGTAAAIAQRVNRAFARHSTARISAQQPPAIRGLGTTGGLSFHLLDRAQAGPAALTDAAARLERAAATEPALSRIDPGDTAPEPALDIAVDRLRAEAMGVPVAQVNAMLGTIFSGTEAGKLMLGEALRPVIVQGDAPWRMQPGDIGAWFARNATGEMVPFDAFVTTRWQPVAPALSRLDGTPSVEIGATPTAGAGSGAAMAAVERQVAALGGTYDIGWTGLSYQERQSGAQAPLLYALSALVVFLALAALYESWTVPLAVMLAAPVGVLGALAAAWATGQADDVYLKIGVLTSIGLSARNAILVVEYAETLRRSGMALVAATRRAVRLRLRPILMTTLTFLLGVLPLALATGPGANAQNAIGIAVLGGMTASVLLALVMVPVLYVGIRRATDRMARPGRVG